MGAKVKSLAVGNGDMFYIRHGSDNFTTIDCCMDDDTQKEIVDELKQESEGKGISRFISTHPDEDHIKGISYLDQEMPIQNFYCVKNEATKETETDSFKKYCELRGSDKAFYISKGCTRKWMNIGDDARGSSGINILWPDTSNEDFKEQLDLVKDGKSPNNISPIIKYSVHNGAKMLWMGDLETTFMEKIEDNVDLSKINILFAPHHGRDSGKVPKSWLDKLKPDIVVIGEAQSKHLNYYAGYNTITQNSAGDITFDCIDRKIHIYVSSDNYSVDFLDNEYMDKYDNYLGTLNLEEDE